MGALSVLLLQLFVSEGSFVGLMLRSTCMVARVFRVLKLREDILGASMASALHSSPLHQGDFARSHVFFFSSLTKLQ